MENTTAIDTIMAQVENLSLQEIKILINKVGEIKKKHTGSEMTSEEKEERKLLTIQKRKETYAKNRAAKIASGEIVVKETPKKLDDQEKEERKRLANEKRKATWAAKKKEKEPTEEPKAEPTEEPAETNKNKPEIIEEGGNEKQVFKSKKQIKISKKKKQ